MKPEKAYTQLYTGNGKGKTTAAIGLAIRAAGAGKKVFFAQFVKGMHYGELVALGKHPEIVVKQYGQDCFIKHKPTPEDIKKAQEGLTEVLQVLHERNFDVIVLDEVCIALYYQLFPLETILKLVQQKPETTEIILTGRYAPQELIDAADLVTEMKEIKHYYHKGIEARKGIEY